MVDYNLLSEVARLYYEQNLTQNEVADRLFISRSSVSRLIKQAKEEGIVEITIRYPYDRMRVLEHEFLDKFSLDEIRIADSTNRSIDTELNAVTKLAASYVNSLLNNNLTLGLTWGKSVYGTVRELRPSGYLPDLKVIQMTGAVESENPFIDGPDLVSQVANTYACKYQHILVPFSVENAQIKESLMRRPQVIEAISQAENVDIMCTGIGNEKDLQKHLMPEEMELINAKHIVGHIAGHFFNIRGELIDIPEINERFVTVGPKIFRNVRYRIAVAANPAKAQAILGALRGGLVNALITNTKTAAKIININNKINKKVGDAKRRSGK